MGFMNNVIDDLIDLTGGDVNKMLNISTYGKKSSGKTYTQNKINEKYKTKNKNIKTINVKKD